jgi:hypothetical protein
MTDANLNQLNAINVWLGDVFGKDVQLSNILQEADLTEAEIEQLNAHHLAAFLQAMVNLISNTINPKFSEQRNELTRGNVLMVRHYGLQNGNPEDFYTIGPSAGVSGNRIRQLVGRRLDIFQDPEYKPTFKQNLIAIAHAMLKDKL